MLLHHKSKIFFFLSTLFLLRHLNSISLFPNKLFSIHFKIPIIVWPFIFLGKFDLLDFDPNKIFTHRRLPKHDYQVINNISQPSDIVVLLNNCVINYHRSLTRPPNNPWMFNPNPLWNSTNLAKTHHQTTRILLKFNINQFKFGHPNTNLQNITKKKKTPSLKGYPLKRLHI